MPPWHQRTRTRPSWWTPVKVLSMLREGQRIAAICTAASEETGGKVSAGVLRNDVLEWSESASMGAQFRDALSMWKRGGVGGGIQLSAESKKRFIESMDEADGKVELACELAGIAPEVIFAVCRDRKSKFYDEDFAEQVQIAEGRRMVALRENVLAQAEEPTPKGARLALSVLSSSMPALHAAKQEVQHVGEVTVQHALAPEVVAASAERTRKLMVGRVVRELPANAGGNNVLDIAPRVRSEVESA